MRSRYLGIARAAAAVSCVEEMEPRLLFSTAVKVKHAPVLHAVKPKKVVTVTHTTKATKAVAVKAKAKPKSTVKTISTATSSLTTHFVASGLNASDISPYDGPAAVSPFTPAQIRHFYGVDSVSFNGIAGNGTGQTIAIIDAYDEPNLVDSTNPNFATSDLHLFDAMYGLPDPPSFTKIDEYGGTNTPTAHVTAWSIEEALDVEWAHAMAPMANIVLVEAGSANDDDLFATSVDTAQSIPGVSVISMSFGEGEFYGESGDDSNFVSTATNPGITYLASTGDTGAGGTSYPSFSPNVIAVGGTSITTSDSNGSYGSEVVWNNNNGNATGGAVSTVETQPAYQSGITLGNGFRATPDVAFDADPNTGVFVYDAADNTGGTHQYRVGGTSLAAPAWAGLIAVADQGRALAGLAPMDGLTATLPRLYQLSSNDFHDIVSGNNGGNSAGVGYDLTTGRGSPVANLLIPDLAGGDTITGRVFQDNNGDGIYNGTDTPFANKTVYLDLNNNGIEDAGEPTAITNASGIYTFSDEIGSLTGVVRLASPPTTGFALVPNTASFTTSYNTAQTVNFAYLPTTYATAVTGTNYTLRLDATGSLEQLLINGISAFSTAISTASSLSFTLAGAGGSLTIDGSNGNPVPSGGITLNGAAGGGDVLTVIGTAAGNDSFTVTSNSITFGANPIAFSNVSSLLLNPGSGTNALAVNSGSVTIPAQSSGGGILARKFSNLTVASGATTQFATATLQSDRTVVVAAALSVSGHLDLGGNDMIVQGGDLTSITSLLAGGYNNGTWTGNGISSSAAHADAAHRTALGVIANTLYGGIGQPLFDGQSPGTGDVLIKYTYYGDTNLDGKVDGTDYSRIDAAYLTHATGWYNGNFNYDSSLNGSDYTLIDNAFNTQGSGL